jgi:hypothetical protein
MAWTSPEFHHGHVSREKGRFWISETSRQLAIHDNWDCNEIVMIELPSHTCLMTCNGLGKMGSKERIPYSSSPIHSEAGKNPKRKYYISLCYITKHEFKPYTKLFAVLYALVQSPPFPSSAE